jgi:hypothetical protein
VTQLENKISVGARIIIHAGGVCVCLAKMRRVDIIRAEGAFGSLVCGKVYLAEVEG